ncbi:hypothetical protein VPHF89G1_0044 [Vibrio phage F89 g1]
MSGKFNQGKRSGSKRPNTKPHCRSRHAQLRKMARYQQNRLHRMEMIRK